MYVISFVDNSGDQVGAVGYEYCLLSSYTIGTYSCSEYCENRMRIYCSPFKQFCTNPGIDR